MEKVRLCDVCDFQGGSQPPKDEWSLEQKDGYIRMLQIRDFTQTRNVEKEYIKLTSTTKTCEADDVLIARYGASVGKILTGLSGAYNVAIMKTIPNEMVLNKPYLKYYLLSDYFQSRINSVGERAAQAGFNKEDLSKLLISLVSLEEQKRIVNELDKVTDLIGKRKEQLGKLDELVKARFVELFGDLMLNPYEWPVVRISDVSLLLKSGLSRKLSDDDIGLPVIRSGNIQNGQFIYDDVKYWYKDDPQGSKTEDYILEDGDILVNFINSASQIGKTAIFRDVGRDCIYTTNIFRMKLSENCNEYYYNWFAMSDYYYRQLQNIIQPAVNQASFTTVNFLKLNIPLPPMELQNQFATFVEQNDKSKLEVQKSLEKLELLKKALMQKYFG